MHTPPTEKELNSKIIVILDYYLVCLFQIILHKKILLFDHTFVWKDIITAFQYLLLIIYHVLKFLGSGCHIIIDVSESRKKKWYIGQGYYVAQ